MIMNVWYIYKMLQTLRLTEEAQKSSQYCVGLEDIAKALRLPPETVLILKSKYTGMNMLHKYEQKKEQRIQSQSTDGLPYW